MKDVIRESVKQYYGEELEGTHSLKTNACCTTESLPSYIKDILPLIDDEIVSKYYGCGSPIPLGVKGLHAMDVGCGTGRDVYLLSKMAGQQGKVYGIDMTDNQISVAQKHIDGQMKSFGYDESNVAFIQDYMENISCHIKKESLDLVISNCVINLSVDKQSVLQQIWDSLKWGGEFYFSDVYADRRISESISQDPVLYGECLGGALYQNDFERMVKKAGFDDPRIISSAPITINDKKIEALTGNIKFYSVTYRLWKLRGLEDACEDYGHIAIYKGGLEHSEHALELDNGHIFEKGLPEKICGNTEKMISQTRFAPYFDIVGSYDTHYGLFKDCGSSTEQESNTNSCGC